MDQILKCAYKFILLKKLNRLRQYQNKQNCYNKMKTEEKGVSFALYRTEYLKNTKYSKR